MGWMPDPKKPEFYRNLVLAVGVPGALSYAISRATGDRMAAAEAARFEKQVQEIIKAENPVISLDPSLDDEAEERAAENIGLADGALLGRASEAFTGKLEPGMLAALGWMAAMAAWRQGRRQSAETQLDLEKSRQSLLRNQLEQTEYDRLHFANDPGGYEAGLAKRSESEPFSEQAAINALVSDESFGHLFQALANHRVAESPVIPVDRSGGLWSGTAVPHKAQQGDDQSEYGTDAEGNDRPDPTTGYRGLFQKLVDAHALVYPSMFAALYLGAMSASKHFVDSNDRNRRRRKSMKVSLAREMLENSSPALLSVGSELPWEKAKHMKAEDAMDASVELPDDIEAKRLRERREVRI